MVAVSQTWARTPGDRSAAARRLTAVLALMLSLLQRNGVEPGLMGGLATSAAAASTELDEREKEQEQQPISTSSIASCANGMEETDNATITTSTDNHQSR